MNERIKELVEKSYIYDRQNDSSFFNKEKFAQLIVQECCQWVNDNLGLLDEEARADLLKHFGVEE
jgi:hypothetical protein